MTNRAQRDSFVCNINELRDYVLSCRDISVKEFVHLAREAVSTYDDKERVSSYNDAPNRVKSQKTPRTAEEVKAYIKKLEKMTTDEASEKAHEDFVKTSEVAEKKIEEFDKLKAVLISFNRGITRMTVKTADDAKLKTNLRLVFNALNAGVNVEYPGQREYLEDKFHNIRPLSGAEWKQREIKIAKAILNNF